jgi:hypothetical protein
MEVQEKHRFDERPLERFMSAEVEGFVPPVRAEQFKGGQSNPTYRLTDGAGRRYVLRRKPPGKLLPSAHAVDREFLVKAINFGQGKVAHSPIPSTAPYYDDKVLTKYHYDPARARALLRGRNYCIADDIHELADRRQSADQFHASPLRAFRYSSGGTHRVS